MTTKIYPADRAFSYLIRTRDKWRCQYPGCGKEYPPPTGALHASHFFSRGKWGTRFDPQNAVAACYGHHSYWDHAGKADYEAFKVQQLGQRGFDALTVRAWARSPMGSTFWKKLSYKKAKEILEPLFE